MGILERAEAQLERDRMRASRFDGAEWPDPVPLPDELPPVPRFDSELLPAILRRRADDIANRMQCPSEYVAVGLLSVLSGAIGRNCGILPKRYDDWIVVPNLWSAVVGRPGVMKTPALGEVLQPIRELEREAAEDHEFNLRVYAEEQAIAHQRKKVAEDSIRKALKERKDPRDAARDAVVDEGAEPVCRRFLLHDPTVEKLGEVLRDNPRGVLLFRDELTGFLRSLDKQGREGDRAFYLEAWNGTNSFTYDRIGRGTVRVEAACVSILGGIQPGPLSAYVRGLRGETDDGLLQRFQLIVYPDISALWTHVDRPPDSRAAIGVSDLVKRLSCLDATRIGAEPGAIPALRFADDAHAEFVTWWSSHEVRLRAGSEVPALEAHLSKYRKLVPALALLLHLADRGEGPVGLISVQRAIAWAGLLEAHARRVYAPAISARLDAARELAKRISRGEIGPQFALRDVYRKGWAGLAEREDAISAVMALEDFEWVCSREEPTAGRYRTVYEVNPKAAKKLENPRNGTDKGDKSPSVSFVSSHAEESEFFRAEPICPDEVSAL